MWYKLQQPTFYDFFERCVCLLEFSGEIQYTFPMKKKLGIYIHIPFCVRKCAYCDFLSAPATKEVQQQYIEALKQEIRSSRELASQYQVATVFFGGGTPSILEGEQLAGILEILRQTFEILPNAEISVECNPGTLTEEKLFWYAKMGVNRLSIGLQSAQNEELRLLGRIHTWEEFLESFWLAREKGFTNINVDLMSALPGQDRSTWKDTLEKVLALEPEHISAYSLIIEEGTPFYERYGEGSCGAAQIEDEALSTDAARNWPELPNEDTERQMYYDTKQILEKAGYHRYEISNYAKPGFESRHNSSYWERVDYKGFGIGAASLINHVRYRNSENLEAYLAGRLEYESEEPLTHKEELEETMFLGLRMMKGVQLNEELRAVYADVLEVLKRKELLTEWDGRVFLTSRGIDVSNYALAEFLLDED